MSLVNDLNFYTFLFYLIIYFYHTVYIAIAFVVKKKKRNHNKPKRLHRFAVLIAARNEEAVIGELIKSIKNQNYPQELIDIYVVADNCTDHTAVAARQVGATVFERFNKTLTGKGYALNYAFYNLKSYYPNKKYDGFFIFDADNILDANYIYEMNLIFDKGFKISTSYRNSKNYDNNWITSGSALWFLYESEYINKPRMALKINCAISGTGCLISNDIVESNDGWPFHLLTEDIQFSVNEAINGEVIGYCDSAYLYDEQPDTFKQSWDQRLRWSKGFYQVLSMYGWKLFKSMFKGRLKNKRFSFSCYDLLMTIFPAMLISVFCLSVNVLYIIRCLFHYSVFNHFFLKIFINFLLSIFSFYAVQFFIGLITTISEWKKIYCRTSKKIFYIFTFPFFLSTYFPIAVIALFKKVQWKPIKHTLAITIDELKNGFN